MAYSIEISPEFEEGYRTLCSKNRAFKMALDNKIRQITENLEFVPDHYKPLKGGMAGIKRVHIESSFVLLFETFKETKKVRLLKIEHHDKAYNV